MIIGFRHKGLEAFYRSGSTRGIDAAHARKLALILAQLDLAVTTKDLSSPSFRLHPLKGSSKGFWSIWVNGNWRVTFCLSAGGVELIDYLDYH